MILPSLLIFSHRMAQAQERAPGHHDRPFSENRATTLRSGKTPRGGLIWVRIGHDQALRASLTAWSSPLTIQSRRRRNAQLRAFQPPRKRPLRPELAAPLGVCPPSRLTRGVGGSSCLFRQGALLYFAATGSSPVSCSPRRGARYGLADLPFFRPDISPVAANRPSVCGRCRPLTLAIGCCCCCHRCC